MTSRLAGDLRIDPRIRAILGATSDPAKLPNEAGGRLAPSYGRSAFAAKIYPPLLKTSALYAFISSATCSVLSRQTPGTVASGRKCCRL